MSTVTIPKQYNDVEKLIAIPESIYEELSIARQSSSTAKTFVPTKSEKLSVEKGRREFKQGKFVSINKI